MDIANPKEFFRDFPRLTPKTVKVTSPVTPFYNCIAWAAGQDTRFWWPRPEAYWPRGVPRVQTVEAFIAAFGTLGYVPVPSPTFEAGKEKVAIYTLDGLPQHAARQLPTGRWTSKCGRNVDIEHDLHELEGPAYGKATHFVVRENHVGDPPAPLAQVPAGR
jgi:hypothetical protein